MINISTILIFMEAMYIYALAGKLDFVYSFTVLKSLDFGG